MKRPTILLQLAVVMLLMMASSCTKDFLEEKANKNTVVPTTLRDLQGMLDNDNTMNTFYPNIQDMSADDFYMLDADWASYTQQTAKSAYIWSDDVFSDNDNNDWSAPYITVQYANIVMEQVDKITATDTVEQVQWNNVKGSALFYRAYAFYTLSQVFAEPYDASSASTALGIALRLKPGFAETSVRATVQQTYDQVLSDAKQAIVLLPNLPAYKTRPGKCAVYGLLARVYLSMRDYTKAGLYADSSLQLNNGLLDYNTLTASAANPVPRFNTEVVFHHLMNHRNVFSTNRCRVDSNLFKLYNTNDLRKTMFYKPVATAQYFVGSYNGNSSLFGGMTTAEMFLIRAEAKARAGDKTGAMADVNAVLQKRYKTGTFTPLTATDATQALTMVLNERRKELIFRGLRWTDLRRLNKEPGLAVTIVKTLNGQQYSLPPNDARYTFILPEKVVQMSGMPQTRR